MSTNEAAERLFNRITSLRHHENVDAAYECRTGVDRCHECSSDYRDLAGRSAGAAPIDVERLGRAYRLARAKAGAFDELDELRQAVMIRDEYTRLAEGTDR